MPRRKNTSHPAGLQTTVMVDVLFILLIFFIVVSRIRESNLQVDLPTVKRPDKRETTAPATQAGISLSIGSKGTIHLDGRKIGDIAALRTALQSRKASTQTPVILRTDKQAPSGITVQVVHLLSDLGFGKIQFDVLTAGHTGSKP